MVLKDQVLPFWQKLLNVLVLFLLGFGLSLANTIEAGKALLSNRDWAFVRTPKYAIQKDSEEWKNKRYQIKLGYDWFLELMAVSLGVIATADAIIYSNFGELVYLIPFTSSFLFVAIYTLIQSRQAVRV